MKPRYLTKSRFKLALECPTKLYYTGKKEYPDKKLDDPFLQALADGGYQVGELAKCYHPGGIDLGNIRDHAESLQRTDKLMQQDECVIYEAAFLYNLLFIRVDVLVKKGNRVNLIEVKSKSFSGEDSSEFTGRNGCLSSAWQPYCYDVAFQKYVLTMARPDLHVSAYLCLADKDARASVDGLNQLFLIRKDSNGRNFIEITGDVSEKALGNRILRNICVDDICDLIYEGEDGADRNGLSFGDWVLYLSEEYHNDRLINNSIGSWCSGCEYDCSRCELAEGLKSGFRECWKRNLNVDDSFFDKPLIFEIWNYRKKQKMIDQGKYLMTDLTFDDVQPMSDTKATEGLSTAERQWLQIKKVQDNDTDPYIDTAGLKSQMQLWRWPLHCIDFETCMVAIPFNKGRRPYEQIAFQYSHHVIHEDGRVEHRSEYIHTERGVFPNFDFVRNLQKDLSLDNGTILRYAAHENTVLMQIRDQLLESAEPDRNDLCQWITTVTTSKRRDDSWQGERTMVDLCDLIKKYYYNPLTHGSNSIKKVLPAVLEVSQFIKDKYSKPIYGAKDGIPSHNYKDWVWLRLDDKGKVIDPYKQLPGLFESLSYDRETLDTFFESGQIADGGAAMTAYAMMQFAEMSDEERALVVNGLLKYCELDTLAMVMIVEYFRDVV